MGIEITNKIDQSNVWDMATEKQKALLKSLDAKTYETVITHIVDMNDIALIETLLDEALGE